MTSNALGLGGGCFWESGYGCASNQTISPLQVQAGHKGIRGSERMPGLFNGCQPRTNPHPHFP